MKERRWLRRVLGITVAMGLMPVVFSSGTAVAQAKSKQGAKSQEHDMALEGKPAPEFAVCDIYGIPRTLSGWRGSPIFLHFGSSW